MSSFLTTYGTPSNLLLTVFLVGAGLLMVKLQRRRDFDWAELVMDERRMVSAGRFLALGAFIVSSWVVMTMAVSQTLDEAFGLGYLAAWSGSMVASKAVDAYRDRDKGDKNVDDDSTVRCRRRDPAGGGSGVGAVDVRQPLAVERGDTEAAARPVGVGRERV